MHGLWKLVPVSEAGDTDLVVPAKDGVCEEPLAVVPVEPDRDFIAETISDAKDTEVVTEADYLWADRIIADGWRLQ